jgi:hypothetical protein
LRFDAGFADCTGTAGAGTRGVVAGDVVAGHIVAGDGMVALFCLLCLSLFQSARSASDAALPPDPVGGDGD